MLTQKQIRTLEKKIKHSEGRRYHVWATPVEIVHLVEVAKVHTEPWDHIWYTRSKESVKKGECGAMWFYFSEPH